MSLFGRILEQLETRLSLADWAWRVGAAVVSFGIPAWAAYATAWLNAYGPIAWVGAGFCGILIVSGGLALVGVFRERLVRTNVERRFYEQVDRINPLENMFQSRRIVISDLLPPVGIAINGKTFIDCEMVGPANIVFTSSAPGSASLSHSGFTLTDAVIVTNLSTKIWNAIQFHDCTFLRCQFFRVTFMVPEPAVNIFIQGISGIQWVNDRSVKGPLIEGPQAQGPQGTLGRT